VILCLPFSFVFFTSCFWAAMYANKDVYTINLFLKTAINILLISNLNSFPVLFDKIACAYILFEKYSYILALEMASQGNQHCADCVTNFTLIDCLNIYRTALRQICTTISRTMVVNDQCEISFPQRTLPRQPNFVGFIHRVEFWVSVTFARWRWTQAHQLTNRQ